MNDKLTPKQERFCLNLFQGMSQHDAYLAAGYSPSQSANTIDRHASELAKYGKVVTRIKELRHVASSPSIMTVEKRKERLSQIAKTDYKTPPTAREVKGAIAELNKMDGAYAPVEVEHTGPGGGPIQVQGFQLVAVTPVALIADNETVEEL